MWHQYSFKLNITIVLFYFYINNLFSREFKIFYDIICHLVRNLKKIKILEFYVSNSKSFSC